MAKLIRIKKWAGNAYKNQFGILFGSWEDTQSAFSCLVAWIDKKTGEVGEANQFTCPFEWEEADIADLPNNADIDEICYQIENS